MPWWEMLLVCFITFIVFAIIHYIGKNKHPFKRAFISIFLGLFTLFAINFTSDYTGVYLPISLMSILISMIGGIPGVTMMLALNLFF